MPVQLSDPPRPDPPGPHIPPEMPPLADPPDIPLAPTPDPLPEDPDPSA
jgi:hypothetical protein